MIREACFLLYHCFRIKDFVNFLFAEYFLALKYFAHGKSRFDCRLCNIRRKLVAYSGTDCGDYAYRIFNVLSALVLVCSDSRYAVVGKGLKSSRKNNDRLKKLVVKHRLGKVKLKLTCLCRLCISGRLPTAL